VGVRAVRQGRQLLWELSALHLHWLCAYDPGEGPAPAVEDTAILDRHEDFVQFVFDDVVRRREAAEAFYADLAADAATGP
jgi:hypothetical protein